MDYATTIERGQQCLMQLRSELLAERTQAGHWTGELSASALSTATAVSALSTWLMNTGSDDEFMAMVKRGCGYLDSQQNADGGYGDTDRSYSNIATSYLVLAARTLAARVIGAEPAGSGGPAIARLQAYIEAQGSLYGMRAR